jgi:hypothetical protein
MRLAHLSDRDALCERANEGALRAHNESEEESLLKWRGGFQSAKRNPADRTMTAVS